MDIANPMVPCYNICKFLNKTVEAFRIPSNGKPNAEGLWRISIMSAEGAKKSKPLI